MRDLLVVGCGKPTSNLCCDVDGFTHRHRPMCDPRPQGLSLEQLHH